MSAVVDRDPALRLWRAETRWLDQCAARLRSARLRSARLRPAPARRRPDPTKVSTR
ncbi:MAG: hypothetical protein ABIQ15_04270 [Nocardioides sp.]